MTTDVHTTCRLCHVPYGTGPCRHIEHLEDGRIAMRKDEWEKLVNAYWNWMNHEAEIEDGVRICQDAADRHGDDT